MRQEAAATSTDGRGMGRILRLTSSWQERDWRLSAVSHVGYALPLLREALLTGFAL